MEKQTIIVGEVEHVVVSVTKEEIDVIFDSADYYQLDYMIGLYKTVFKRANIEWDDISEEGGVNLDAVRCNEETARYLCSKCIAWDKANNVSSLPGGLWLNNGFNRDDSVGDFMFKVTPCHVELK